MISDQNNSGDDSKGRSWQLSNVPQEHGITGLGPVFVKVENAENLRTILETVFGFRYAGQEDDLHLLKWRMVEMEQL